MQSTTYLLSEPGRLNGARPHAMGASASTLSTLLKDYREFNSIRTRSFQEGESLYEQGQPTERIYLIRSGMVKIANHMENGRCRIIRFHTSGDLLGMEAVMDPVMDQNAVAMIPSLVTEIPLSVINSIEKQDPGGFCELLKVWHRHLKLANLWITDFSTGGVRKRISRLLLFLAERDKNSGNIVISLPKVEELSEALGVTPESTSRVMAELKRQRVIVRLSDNRCEQYRLHAERL